MLIHALGKFISVMYNLENRFREVIKKFASGFKQINLNMSA